MNNFNNINNLKEVIYKRKSTRKYDMTPLGSKTIEDILRFASSAASLREDIKVEHEIFSVKNVRGIFPVKAPHYIAISSAAKDDCYLTNAGFILQQTDLYLQSIGLGSCWLGSGKPASISNNSLEFVILLAFGKPPASESVYRDSSGFKRKTLKEISDIADERLEAARLAPSSINSQPWYFTSERNTIHVYRVKNGAFKGLIYDRMNKIDIGIALAHIYISNGGGFNFFTAKNPVQRKGYCYMGSVEL